MSDTQNESGRPGEPVEPIPSGSGSGRERRSILTMALAGLVIVLAAAAGGATLGHEFWAGSSTTVSFSTSQGSGSNGSSGFFGRPPFNGFGNQAPGQGSFGEGGGFSGRGGSSSGQGSFGFGSSSSGSSAPGAPSNVASIAAKVNGALVDIDSTLGYQSAAGAGTGIVLSSNGLVLTNNHVIEGSTKLTATDVGNGKTYQATVVGYDPTHDVALLQLQGATGLQTAKIGDSAKATVGEAVVGIGNAGGEGGTPSAAGGSITSLNASVTAADELGGASERLTGLIGVDAGIQSGDSGGPLVDGKGEVIGMNTAGSAGFAFTSNASSAYAIPIDMAISIVGQLEAGHPSSTAHLGPTAFLGVGVLSGRGEAGGFGSFGGSSNGASTSGVTIGNVVSGEPAEEAGLAAGDVITSLGGKSVTSRADLSGLMLGHHPGEKVEIGWKDSSGKAHTSTVKLASGPPA